MRTLTSCIKKLKTLDARDVDEIKSLVQDYINQDGLAPSEAAIEAVTAQISSLLDARTETYRDADAGLAAALDLSNYDERLTGPAEPAAQEPAAPTRTQIVGNLDLVDPAIAKAAKSAIARESKAEQKRLNENLETFKGTGWAGAAIRGLAIREIFHLAKADAQGNIDTINRILDSDVWGKEAGHKMRRNSWIRAAMNGEWEAKIVSYNDFISDNRKAEKALSTSMKNCDPSMACASHCYVVTGQQNNNSSVIKSEATEWAAEFYPELFAERVMISYRTSPLHREGLALRLNDKGDLSPSQVKLTETMKDNNVRMQIFSKRPDLLSKVSDFHLRMLSVDGTNLDTAYGHDHLLAVTLTEEMNDQTMLDLLDTGRVAVVMPVNLQGKEWEISELKKLWPKSFKRMKPVLCPVEAGQLGVESDTSYVEIAYGKNKSKLMTCTTCDLWGSAGCFGGGRDTASAKINMANTIASSTADPDEQARIAAVNAVRSSFDEMVNKGEITSEQRDEFLEAIYRSSGQVQQNDGREIAERSGQRDRQLDGEAGGAGGPVRQTQLGFEFGESGSQDIYQNIEVRPNTTEAQKSTGRSALLDLLRTVESRYRRRGGKGEITGLGAAIVKNLKDGKPASLIGQEVNHSVDLAFLAQVYRDPRLETLRYFIVKDGKVVQERAVSSRLPSAVAFDARFIKSLSEDLAAAGDGAKFYLLHNHPAGDATPSDADIQMTRDFGRLPQFAAHVVLDHNEFANINADGVAITQKAPSLESADFRANPEIPNDYMNTQVDSVEQIANLGKMHLTDPNNAVVIMVDARRKVTGMFGVPVDFFEIMGAKKKGLLSRQKKGTKMLGGGIVSPRHEAYVMLRRLARETGAGGNISIVLPPGQNVRDYRGLFKGGAVTTLVADNEYIHTKGSPFSNDFDATDGVIRQRADRIPPRLNDLGLYSELENRLENVDLPGWRGTKDRPNNAARAEDIAAYLRAAPLRREELEWSGLVDFLAANKGKRFTRQQILNVVSGLAGRFTAVTDGALEGQKNTRQRWQQDEYVIERPVSEMYEAIYEILRSIPYPAMRLDGSPFPALIEEVIKRDFEYVSTEIWPDHAMQGEELTLENLRSVMDQSPRFVSAAMRSSSQKRIRDAIEDLDLEDVFWASTDGYVTEDPDGNLARIYGSPEWGWVSVGDVGYAEPRTQLEEIKADVANDIMGFDPDGGRWGNLVVGGPNEGYLEDKVIFDTNDITEKFSYTIHFPEDNILGFLRMSSRDDGDTVLIEELQSDWHQKGRQDGYRKAGALDQAQQDVDTSMDEMDIVKDATKEFIDDEILAPLHDTYGEPGSTSYSEMPVEVQRGISTLLNTIKIPEYAPDDYFSPTVWQEVQNKYRDSLPFLNWNRVEERYLRNVDAYEQAVRSENELMNLEERQPDAPMKNDAWVRMLAKRALVLAAQTNAGRLSWVTSDILAGSRYSDQYAELYQNLYDRKLVSEIRKLTGKTARKQWLDQNLDQVQNTVYQWVEFDPSGAIRDVDHWSAYTPDEYPLERQGEEGPAPDSEQVRKGMEAASKTINRIRPGSTLKYMTWGEIVRNYPREFASYSRAEGFEETPQQVWSIELTPETKERINEKGFPLFRVTKPAKGGMAKTDVISAVKDRALDLGVGVNVYQSVSELPANVLESMKDQGIESALGYYMRDEQQIYLIADNIPNKREAQITLIHEAVGHMGIERLMGDRIGELLVAVRDTQDRRVRETWDEVSGLYPGAGDAVLAAETIARVAEQEPKNGIVQKAIQLVRKALKALGFNLMFTNGDLIETLNRAKKALKDPDAKVSSEEQGPLFAARDEMNRRMREQHQSTFYKAKQQAKRYLSPGGLLPKSVFEEKIVRDSKVEAGELDIRYHVVGLEEAFQKDYGKSFNKRSAQETADLDAALRGNPPANMPQRTAVAIEEMRQHIDKRSTQYLRVLRGEIMRLAQTDPAAAQAKIDLFDTIFGNRGEYLHRSYQAFDDPNWPKKVPDSTMNAARDLLEQQHLAQNPGATQEQAELAADRVIADILKVGTAFDSMESYIKESKLGAKDLSLLKRRQDIAPEIRALLGEYTDPRVNFTKTVSKMDRLIFNSRLLEKIRDIGMGVFLFEDGQQPSDAYVTIAAESSEVYAPLNGLRTYPDFNQALIDSLGKDQTGPLLNFAIRMNGMVKFGKTVLSPTTAMRNFMSAAFFSVANGHINPKNLFVAGKTMGTYFKGRGGYQGYLRKLKELGVVYDTPYAGEMMRLLEEAHNGNNFMADRLGASWALKTAQRFYQFGDDFWKIVGFENEVALQKKHYGLDDAAAMKAAAHRIRNTYPTYSMVGKAVNMLRRNILVGTFVSFPAEIIRTSINMLKFMQQDMRQSPALGMRRLAGLTTVASFAYAAQEMFKESLGVDDEEDEAYRDQLAQWNRNSNLLYMDRDNGKIRFLDISFLDPYNYWKRPINALMRDEPMDEQAIEAIREMVEPFFGSDITFSAIAEIWKNEKSYGGEVYDKDADVDVQIGQIGEHLFKAVRPGIMANIDNIMQATSGEVSRSGRQREINDELAALVGFRVTTLDPKVSLAYRAYDIRDRLASARTILTRAATDPNPVTDMELLSTLDDSLQRRMEAYQDLLELVESARVSGMTDSGIYDQLSQAFSQRNARMLAAGRIPMDVPTGRWLSKQIKGAASRYGDYDPNIGAEFARRRTVLRKQYGERWMKMVEEMEKGE